MHAIESGQKVFTHTDAGEPQHGDSNEAKLDENNLIARSAKQEMLSAWSVCDGVVPFCLTTDNAILGLLNCSHANPVESPRHNLRENCRHSSIHATTHACSTFSTPATTQGHAYGINQEWKIAGMCYYHHSTKSP